MQNDSPVPICLGQAPTQFGGTTCVLTSSRLWTVCCVARFSIGLFQVALLDPYIGTAVTRFHQIARIVSRFLEPGTSIKWKLVEPELWLDCPPHPISRCPFGLVGWRYIYSSPVGALCTLHLRSLWFLVKKIIIIQPDPVLSIASGAQKWF